jgi:hypothetical protein
MKTSLHFTLGITVALAALAPPAGAVTYALRGSVVANGGTPGSNATYGLHGTAGQAAIGLSTGGAFKLCHGFWCFGGSRVLAVDPGGNPLPRELSFGLPAPNPTRGETRFSLALPRDADVTLTVYDVAGRILGEPARQHLGAGYHQLFWQAPAGQSGVYFARLLVDGAVHGERRIVLVR